MTVRGIVRRASMLDRRWWQAMVAAVIVTLAVVAIGEGLGRSRGSLYQAEALVVASELAIPPETLPKTAVSIFNGGEVAARTALLAGGGFAPSELIPAVVVAEPVEDSLAIEIEARHPDPELAARYATAAAEAFVFEMNGVGDGLGRFELVHTPEVPTVPVPTGRRDLAVAAVLSGSAVGLAVLWRWDRSPG